MINKLWIIYDTLKESMPNTAAKYKALSDILKVIVYLEGADNENRF